MSRKIPYCKVCHDAGKPEAEYTSHWVKTLPDHLGNTTVTCPILLSTECRYCDKLGHTTKFCPVIKQNKKEKERAERQKMFEESHMKKISPLTKPLKSNGFDMLGEESSDSEPEVEVSKIKNTIIEEFPSLGSRKMPSVACFQDKQKPSFADMVSKSSSSSKKTGFLSNPSGEKVVLEASRPVREPVREPAPTPIKEPIQWPTPAPIKQPIREPIYLPGRAPFQEPNPTQIQQPNPTQIQQPIRAPIIRGYCSRRKNWADYSDSDDEDEDFEEISLK